MATKTTKTHRKHKKKNTKEKHKRKHKKESINTEINYLIETKIKKQPHQKETPKATKICNRKLKNNQAKKQ